MRDSGHMEEMVSTAPPSFIPRCTRVPGGLFCQPVFASVGMESTQKMKNGIKRAKSRRKRGRAELANSSGRLRVYPQ